MTTRFIRPREVCARVGYHISHIWRLEKQGQFPQRVRIGPCAVGYVESEIDEWINFRIHDRGMGPKPALALAGRARQRAEAKATKTKALVGGLVASKVKFELQRIIDKAKDKPERVRLTEPEPKPERVRLTAEERAEIDARLARRRPVATE
ncbi:MAG: AlpA family phage regulatory protein [Terriglobia bacterium]